MLVLSQDKVCEKRSITSLGMSVMSLSPLSEVFVVHSVGKSFSTDSNSLKDSVTSQLLHDQMGINYTYARKKRRKEEKINKL